MNTGQKEEELTLEILRTIDGERDLTQRRLARRLGVALGLANSYLKRCVKKGLVKIQQAPANRYFYYLTPKGFSEKSRLTAQYLSHSFEFYRNASDSCSEAFLSCRQRGWESVLLCGVSELAEIASLRALDHRMRFVGIYDRDSPLTSFLDRPVWHSLNDVGAFDACLLTALEQPSARYRELLLAVERERVIIPELLRPALGIEEAAA